MGRRWLFDGTGRRSLDLSAEPLLVAFLPSLMSKVLQHVNCAFGALFVAALKLVSGVAVRELHLLVFGVGCGGRLVQASE